MNQDRDETLVDCQSVVIGMISMLGMRSEQQPISFQNAKIEKKLDPKNLLYHEIPGCLGFFYVFWLSFRYIWEDNSNMMTQFGTSQIKISGQACEPTKPIVLMS